MDFPGAGQPLSFQGQIAHQRRSARQEGWHKEGQGPDGGANSLSSVIAKAVFFLASALIAYGSFYPFDFRVPGSHDLTTRLEYFASALTTGRGDLLGNLVLFVPFGLAGMLAFANRANSITVIVVLSLMGTAFAAALQVGQLLLPTRDPSAFDLLLNAMGLAVGIGVGLHPRLLGASELSSSRALLSVPFLIGAIWPLAQLLPLIPTIDFANFKAAFKPFLAPQSLSLTQTSLHLFAWLASLHLLATAPLTPGRALWLPAIPLVVLCAQPFVVGGQIGLPELVGTLGAVAAWYGPGRRLDPKFLGLCLLAAALAANLLPWESSLATRSFSLVPFSGFLEGNMLTNSNALLNKLFVYAGTIWLLQRDGGRVWSVTALVTLTLLAQELLQTRVLVGTPEITDPLLAVVLGVLIHFANRAAPVNDP